MHAKVHAILHLFLWEGKVNSTDLSGKVNSTDLFGMGQDC